jgi:hypothetical protein
MAGLGGIGKIPIGLGPPSVVPFVVALAPAAAAAPGPGEGEGEGEGDGERDGDGFAASGFGASGFGGSLAGLGPASFCAAGLSPPAGVKIKGAARAA